MSLAQLLEERRAKILDGWRERILATYPQQSGKHLKHKKGPVGEIIASSTSGVVDGFVGGAGREEISPHLNEIVRLRAVQEFSAAQSVGFVFALKDAVRDALGTDISAADLAGLDRRVDELALLAFDLFVGCRERVFDLRAKMMRDRSYMLMRRAGMLWEESEDMAEPEISERGDGR